MFYQFLLHHYFAEFQIFTPFVVADFLGNLDTLILDSSIDVAKVILVVNLVLVGWPKHSSMDKYLRRLTARKKSKIWKIWLDKKF